MTIHTLARALGLAIVVSASPAQAKQTEPAPAFDRHNPGGGYSQQQAAAVKQMRRKHQRRYQHRDKVSKYYARKHIEGRTSARREVQLLPHPAGCPSRSFCGCGAALEVFGSHVRDLWLARNWFRFPPASPAPGMVAVRRHHVFVIREVRGPGLVLAYDANSGGRKTRLHLRSLAGYRVVNPSGSRYATAG